MSLLTEIQTGPLAAELAPFVADGNDGAIADALNRKDIPAKGEVTAHNIRQYLTLVGLLIPIEDATAMSCREAARVLEIFPVIDLSNPMILGKFTQVLDGLVAEALIPDFTETHKLTILSLADTLISRMDQLGWPAVSVNDVAKAVRNDDGSSKL